MPIPLRICLCLLLCSAGCASPGGGGKPPATRASNSAAYSDWVQLNSGEWLKGRIKSMQNWELEIDSQELYDLDIDWDDVKEVHMSHATILYGDKKTATGALTVGPDKV